MSHITSYLLDTSLDYVRPLSICSCLRQSTIVTLFTLLICGVARASAQAVIPTPPEAKGFRLGALEISVLRDGSLAVPNDGSVFGLNTSTAEVAEVLRHANVPTDKIYLDSNVLLIRMRKHLVLIDTGYGYIGRGALMKSLASVGVSPAEITDILVTHVDPDHVGGLVDAQGRSVFSKATIRMSVREWKHMQNGADTGNEVPVIKAQVQTFEPGQSVLPGIVPVPLYGHTTGHVGYEIKSQGYRLVDIGDVVHSSIVSLANRDWVTAWDLDQKLGMRTRNQELRELATTHELIFAPHFPLPRYRSDRDHNTGLLLPSRTAIQEPSTMSTSPLSMTMEFRTQRCDLSSLSVD
jgi:glyoxylase-like metal-dependent hydrolase (beta-lactamase superfamily II)